MTKAIKKVYEVGIHIVPDLKEKEAVSLFNSTKSEIAKVAEVISFDEPELINLAYTIRHNTRKEDGTYNKYDEAFFCSIKFETAQENVEKIKVNLKGDDKVLRHLLVETIRENTRISLPEEENVEKRSESGKISVSN